MSRKSRARGIGAVNLTEGLMIVTSDALTLGAQPYFGYAGIARGRVSVSIIMIWRVAEKETF